MASGTRFHRGDAEFAELAASGFMPDAKGRVGSRHRLQAKGRRRQATTLQNLRDLDSTPQPLFTAASAVRCGRRG